MAGTATSVASMGTNWVSQVFEDAMVVFRANNVMSNLGLRFSDRIGDESRASTGYNQLTAGTVAETTDITVEQEFTKTNIANLTPYEAYSYAFLTDRRQETDPQNARADVSLELGQAMADKYEQDQLANFSGFTGGTISTGGGTALTWGALFAARTTLKSTKVPGPYIAVIHENAWHQLAKSVSLANTSQSNAPDSLKDLVKSQWYIGTYGDLSIFTTSNIAAGTLVNQGVFNRQAFALDVRRAPRLEPQRDASRRGFELVMTSKYATGVWRPKAGVLLKSDASLPTS